MRPEVPAPPVPYRAPVWPKVVGIISICVGSLQVLAGMSDLAGTFIMPIVMKNMQGSNMLPGSTTSAPASDLAAVFMTDLPPEQRRLQIGASVVSLAAGGLLISADIRLLRRKRSARALHLIHVAAKAAAVAMAIVATCAIISALEASMAEDVPQIRTAFRGAMGLGIALQVLFGMAYPTFLLIWFLRPTIARQVRQW